MSIDNPLSQSGAELSEQSPHTLVVSDLHLADVERGSTNIHPLWKRYKKAKFFIDRSFGDFLTFIQEQVQAPIELIFNGDTFDFDSVVVLPEKLDTGLRITWLERIRGLSPEEQKSRFKIKSILEAHPLWIEYVQDFLIAGHRLVFIIGNHDLELHWPAVQEEIIEQLGLSSEQKKQVIFCEWFYVSHKDTLIEHGNQYDAYCLCSNPVHPLIRWGKKNLVRLPFGNLACRFMVNGIGLMNPHTSSSFIKASFWEYLVFYYKYMFSIQPFLLYTWFWSAMVTLLMSIQMGFRPALRDPLTVDARISEIARRAQASFVTVLALKELHVHPAIFAPMKILRELWLDRVLLLFLILFGSFQIFSLMNIISFGSIWWFVLPVLLFLPGFIFYSRSVQSEVEACEKAVFHYGPVSAKIAQVKRLVHGHTHHEIHTEVDQVEMVNTGTWSPAFVDIECTKPFGRKCFAWIKPDWSQKKRIVELYEWSGRTAILIPREAAPIPPDKSKLDIFFENVAPANRL